LAVALGLRQPQVALDRNLIRGASIVEVKVTATNGFQSEATTCDFSVDEL